MAQCCFYSCIDTEKNHAAATPKIEETDVPASNKAKKFVHTGDFLNDWIYLSLTLTIVFSYFYFLRQEHSLSFFKKKKIIKQQEEKTSKTHIEYKV